jgi:hypothetical protein
MDDPRMKFSRGMGLEIARSGGLRMAFGLALLLACLIGQAEATAQSAKWIWSPKVGSVTGEQPQGDCYFRSKFTLIKPEKAEIIYAAGDEYELYINNRLVSKGESYGSENKLDVFSYVKPGVNLVAVKVSHLSSDQPGVALKVRIKERDETRWRSMVTNNSWKTRNQLVSGWTENGYNDMGWLKARVLNNAANLGLPKAVKTAKQAPPAARAAPVVAPIVSAAKNTTTVEASSPAPVASPAAEPTKQAGVEAVKKQAVPVAQVSTQVAKSTDREEAAVAKTDGNVGSPPQPVAPIAPLAAAPAKVKKAKSNRFELDSEFVIEQVLTSQAAGPMVAMEFNEFGKLLFSRQDGPLMIADLSLPADDPARVRVYCDKVKSCGGILPINGDVYVTGDGPSGSALYRLSDTNNDGKVEPTKALFKFSGEFGGHGPHGLRLGPDAMIYMVLGNGSQVDRPASDRSPYKRPYEGNVVPRMEDPKGHAAGVEAPGGTIVRCSIDGTQVETFAGGLRNSTDLAFNANGQLFVCDSDNPADVKTPWYRPSMVFHVPAGAELGWRSGSGKFPTHAVDTAQPVCQLESGMPTGSVVYRHMQFPARFHDVLFTANRTTGKIFSVRTNQSGAGYSGSLETFLTGKKFDITDLSIGEDGMMYIATGDRGSVGGLYRVRWKGEIPEKMLTFDSDLSKVIRHPQPDSSWARQNVAQLKITMGRDWATSIRGVATEVQNPARFRVRAMQLMVLYGPKYDARLLGGLTTAPEPEIRAQVAALCAASEDVRNQQVLNDLLGDTEPMVRRAAAEAMLSLGVEPEFSTLKSLLASEDRTEAFVARRLLERIPSARWKEEILTTDDKRVFIQGAAALAIAEPKLETSYNILARGSKFMDGFVSDTDFVDMLRVMQLALVQAQVAPSDIPGFARRIASEFPSADSIINLELARLLGYLKAASLEGRLETYLGDDDVKHSERLAVAMQLRASAADMTDDELLAMLRFMQSSKSIKQVGSSYQGYIDLALDDCSEFVNAAHLDEVLDHPMDYVSALIPVFYHVPVKLDDKMLSRLINLDKDFAGKKDARSLQIRLGVIALLAQSGDEQSMVYLRKLWQQEDYRRSDIAIGLAQQPEGENWSYLVSTIPVLEPSTTPEVLNALKSVARKPRDGRHFRELVGVAERNDKASVRSALALLEHWSGESLADGSGDRSKLVASWKKWCDEKFNESPSASTAAGDGTDRR